MEIYVSSIAAILVAIISSYFAYLKLQNEFSLNYKKQIIDYLYNTYIANGFMKVDDYLSITYNILIESRQKTMTINRYKEIKPPFYIIKLLDLRYNTNWFFPIETIHLTILNSLTATGKSVPVEVIELSERIIRDINFFRTKQELSINASSFMLFIWKLKARILFYKNRKKILLLTRNIADGGSSGDLKLSVPHKNL